MNEAVSILVKQTKEEITAKEDSKEGFEELLRILSKCGVTLREHISAETLSNGEKLIVWTFGWNNQVVKTKTTRNAGGKTKWLKVTLGDMKKQLAESTLEEVAKKYGVSGRTIQRKLVKAREYGLRDEDELY